MMSELDSPDIHHRNAAQGWLELGNPTEALAELERITAENQEHPDVLETRWSILAHQKRWEEALVTAERLVAKAPDRCSGWINQSYSLHELRRTAEARTRLLPVARKFPKVETIPYNLACYYCQLGELEEARTWLAKAKRVGGARRITDMALADRDLEPLWPELRRHRR